MRRPGRFTVRVWAAGLRDLLREAELAGVRLRYLNAASPDRVQAWEEHERYRHMIARMLRPGSDPDLCRGRPWRGNG